MNYAKVISAELSLGVEQTEKTIALIDDGNTIPFIARYRKEVTGGIDDQVLRQLADRLQALRALEARRDDILRLITEQDKLTPELEAKIAASTTMAALEDLYRPYRPKRKTRASVAREKGLEPLADILMSRRTTQADLDRAVAAAIRPDKGVSGKDEAIAGAEDIVAERLSDDPALRGRLRGILTNTGRLVSRSRKKDTKELLVYEAFADFSEAVSRIPGHRILAINRGEKEELLSVTVAAEEDLVLSHILSTLPSDNPVISPYLRQSSEDAWKRLLHPSLTTEIRSALTERAEEEAMRIFAQNLKSLLMIPPMRGHTVLALDPAFRTGCKLAIIDPTGRSLHTGVIFPTPPQSRVEESSAELDRLIQRFSVTLIAFGNGTASRETERFLSDYLRDRKMSVKCLMVNEAGASVYSASPLAAAEFPDLDLTKRSAISIGRRLQDPLAELVKIDPQSIGVGQYQHDIDTKRLSHTLGGVVESCVNDVGADLNTASESLLSYIAGVNTTVAKNIVEYRSKNGAFRSRAELLKVPRLGPKVYTQCAGFLRVADSDEPLDNTRIHPESYIVARAVAKMPKPIQPELVAETLGVGLPTLQDILAALANPGFDPRAEIAQPELRSDVTEISDLREGMTMTGVVRNVSAFGAFVDIGVHQDGLVHISEMSDNFVKDPFTVVRVGQTVRVRVLSVDAAKKRISLSMKG